MTLGDQSTMNNESEIILKIPLTKAEFEPERHVSALERCAPHPRCHILNDTIDAFNRVTVPVETATDKRAEEICSVVKRHHLYMTGILLSRRSKPSHSPPQYM